MLNYTFLATKDDIAAITTEKVAEYRYIALIELGQYADTIVHHEYVMLCVGLQRYMKEDCLIAIASEMNDAPEKSVLKSVYRIFDPQPQFEAYIGLGTLFPSENEELYIAPVYQEIKWNCRAEARFPYYDALNQSLSALKTRLYYATLNDYPLPPLPPAVSSLLIPNSERIKKLRKEQGLTQIDLTEVQIPGTVLTSQANRKTIMRTEKGEPVKPDTLQHISYCLKVPLNSLFLSEVIVYPSGISIAKGTFENCNRSKITEWFGADYEYFFSLLEGAELVSSEIIKYVYYYYQKTSNDVLGAETKLSELVDNPKTSARAQKESPV